MGGGGRKHFLGQKKESRLTSVLSIEAAVSEGDLVRKKKESSSLLRQNPNPDKHHTEKGSPPKNFYRKKGEWPTFNDS